MSRIEEPAVIETSDVADILPVYDLALTLACDYIRSVITLPVGTDNARDYFLTQARKQLGAVPNASPENALPMPTL